MTPAGPEPALHQLRRPAFVAAFSLLIAIGGLGLWSSTGEWSAAHTPGQRVATATELAYGILGVVAAFGVLGGHSWAGAALNAFAVALAVTAGLAPVVWGGQRPLIGLGAFVATGMVAAAIVWFVRRAGSRPDSPPIT